MDEKKNGNIEEIEENVSKQILAYKQRIAELEQLAIQKQIWIDFTEKMIEIAIDKYGIDVLKSGD